MSQRYVHSPPFHQQPFSFSPTITSFPHYAIRKHHLCVAAILSTVAGFSSPTIITRNAALTKINVNSNSLNFSAQQSQLHMSDAVADSGDVSQKEDEIVEKVSTRITIRAYT